MPSSAPVPTSPRALQRSSSEDQNPLRSPALSTTSSTLSSPHPPRVSSLNTTNETRLFCKIRTNRSRSTSMRRSDSSLSQTSPISSSPVESRPDRLSLRSDSSLTVAPTRGRSRSAKRNSGTVMQVGRHGNDWLFGGFSFTESIKSLLSPTNSEHSDR